MDPPPPYQESVPATEQPVTPVADESPQNEEGSGTTGDGEEAVPIEVDTEADAPASEGREEERAGEEKDPVKIDPESYVLQQQQIELLKRQVQTMEAQLRDHRLREIHRREEEAARQSVEEDARIPKPPRAPQGARSARRHHDPQLYDEGPKTAREPEPRAHNPRKLANSLLVRFHPSPPPNKSPPALEGATAVAYKGSVWIFGGTNGTQMASSVWRFDPTEGSWKKATAQKHGAAASVPPGRHGHTAVERGGIMYVCGGIGYGGYSLNEQGEMEAAKASVFMGKTNKWVDSERGYAPETIGLLNTVWSLNIETNKWTELHCSPPMPPLKNHAAAIEGGVMFVFGGCTMQGRTNVMRALDIQAQTWMAEREFNSQFVEAMQGGSPEGLPPPVSGHTLTLWRGPSPDRVPSLLCWGGRMGKHFYSRDLFRFSLSSRTWSRLECTGDLPRPRAGHSAVVWQDWLVVFGGYTSSGKKGKLYLNDISILDLETLEWKKAAVTGSFFPQGRCGHAAALLRGGPESPIQMALFGGWGEAGAPQSDPTGRTMSSPRRTGPPPMCDVNNDMFLVTLSHPKPKPKAMPAPAVAADVEASNQSTNPRREPKPQAQKAFTVAKHRERIPSLAASPRFAKPLPAKLPASRIDRAVLRLYNIEATARERERLDRKYIPEQEKWQMTLEEQDNSIDRLYYQQMEIKDAREKEQQERFHPEEEPRILDDDEVYDLVERLSQRPPPKEAPPEERVVKTINQDGVEGIIDRLYHKQLEFHEIHMNSLQNKYAPVQPSTHRTKAEVETMVQRLYEAQPPPKPKKSPS